MNEDKKMILGYIVGGLLVLVLVPSIIYLITSLIDNVYRVEIFRDPVIKWITIIILFVTGFIYGIWSIIIQNTVGHGGPVEIGNIEISPKTKNLVVSGPYKHTRNPMLFGAFLMYLAYALVINSVTSLVIVCAIFTFMLTVVVKMEEKRLLKDFGDQYAEYRKKVSMFIPWSQRKTRTIPFFLCLLLLFSGKGLSQNQAESNNDWKMVWQDEFDGKRPDTNKWNVLIRETSKHNELQYYVPDEVYIENGLLRIRSRVRKFGSKEYTSGRLDTEGKFAPTYGRFEIRARLPKGQGLWPAHWLYPQNRDWLMEKTMEDAVANGKERLIPEERPWYTEIDIMEFLGHEPSILYGTLHYCSFDGSRKSSSGKWVDTVDFSQDFHVYALEWEPDSIRWYIDGHLLHSTTDGIPHTPHYLILNTAVGGSWPGNPDSTTTFPQYHDIDYVRIFQKKPYFE